MNLSRAGIVMMVLSNVLFAMLYLYGHWMQPVSGTDVFAWRMVSMFVGLLVLMFATGGWRHAYQLAQRWRRQPAHALLFLATTPIVAFQLWLFMWAPVNGYALDVAMGYFLFPLAMVLLGCLFLGERLNGWQGAAIALAVLGVGHELWHTQAFSWVTLAICLGYPPYYFLRRYLQVPALVGLFGDLCLIAPPMAWYLWQHSGSLPLVTGSSGLMLLVVLLGASSALAMYWNLAAARLLPMTLFGMLSYMEPVLLFVCALVFLQAPTSMATWLTYGLIWAGLSLMLWDGWLKLRQPRATAPAVAAEASA